MQKKTLSVAAIVITVVAFSGFYIVSARASGPSVADVKNLVAEHLSDGWNWEMKSLTVTASETNEWMGREVYTREFKADVTAIEARFSHIEAQFSYIFVDYAVQVGDVETLSGEVRTAWMDGEWQGDVHFTNSVGLTAGESENELRRRYGQNMTIVFVGTPAEEEARQAILESIQQIEGEWVGRSICDNTAHDIEYLMALERGSDWNVFSGEVSFVPGLENQSVQPGSFTVNARYCAGLFCDSSLAINHGSWIERSRRHGNQSFSVDIEEDKLIGRMRVSGGMSCSVQFERA